MHPAISVIFFTVLSGFGYGLFMSLTVVGIFNTEINANVVVTGSIIALLLVTGGLLSSTLHLANPKNAWRAFSRFRTSWLSREGVLAMLFYLPALLYLGCWRAEQSDEFWRLVLSLLVFVLSLATVFSTGMIYACLKTIRQWHTPLTPTNYILLAVMPGFLLFLLLHQWYVGGVVPLHFLATAIVLIVLAGVMKLIYYALIIKSGGLTVNTATSLTQAKVRLLDVGHTAGTFLTDEFAYRVTSQRLARLRFLSIVLAFIVPLLLFLAVVLGLMGSDVIGAALLSATIGIFVERWLFFADARHVVNLYHGEQRA